MRFGQPVGERFLRQAPPVGNRGKAGHGRIGREERRLDRMAPPARRLDKRGSAGVGRRRGRLAHHRRRVVGVGRGGAGGEREACKRCDESAGMDHAGFILSVRAAFLDRDQFCAAALNQSLSDDRLWGKVRGRRMTGCGWISVTDDVPRFHPI